MQDPPTTDPFVTPDGASDDAGPSTTGPTALPDVSPQTLDFGGVPCGETSSAPQVLKIQNHGPDDVPYEVRLPEGTAFSFVGASTGIVKGDDVALVSLSAKPPSADDLAADVVVKVGPSVVFVPAKVKGLGGKLEISPKMADFGDVRATLNDSPPIAITLRNSGNRDLSLNGFFNSNTADFDVLLADKPLPASVTIPAGGTLETQAILKGNVGPGKVSAAWTMKSVFSCNDAPAVELHGNRVLDTVTTSPGAVDFGGVMCRTPSTQPQTVTVSNYQSTPVGYDATLPTGSAFTIVSGAKGTLTAAKTPSDPSLQTIVLAVNPVSMPAAPVTENLTIQLSPAPQHGPAVKTVALTVLPTGAVVTADPMDLDYKIYNNVITLSNTGNTPTTLAYQTTSDSAPEFKKTKGTVTIEGGKTAPLNVSFWNGLLPQGKSYQATIVLTKVGGAEVCTDLPLLKAHTDY